MQTDGECCRMTVTVKEWRAAMQRLLCLIMALLFIWGAACAEETMPVLYRKMKGDVDRIEARNIADWVGTEDAGLRQVLDDIIERLARVAVNSITLLAPDKVIIYGELFEYPLLEERFRYFCSHYDESYNNDYILKSELSDRIEYIGPLAVVMNELFLLAGIQED